MKRSILLVLCLLLLFDIGCTTQKNEFQNLPNIDQLSQDIADKQSLDGDNSKPPEPITAEAQADENQPEPISEQPEQQELLPQQQQPEGQQNPEQAAQPEEQQPSDEQQNADPAQQPEDQQNADQAQQPEQQPAPEQQPIEEPQPAPEAGLDFAKLAPSTQMSYEELVGDNGNYDEVQNIPEAGTYKLEIDVVNNVLIVFDANGEIVRIMPCTTGKKKTRTPTGTYRIGSQRKRFGYFDEFDCYAQYWTQVVDGIFIHSVLYRKKDASTLIRSSYRNMGKSSSHGCIRLTVPDARWIYENIAKGTTVEIIKKDKDDFLKESLKLPPIS